MSREEDERCLRRREWLRANHDQRENESNPLQGGWRPRLQQRAGWLRRPGALVALPRRAERNQKSSESRVRWRDRYTRHRETGRVRWRATDAECHPACGVAAMSAIHGVHAGTVHRLRGGVGFSVMPAASGMTLGKKRIVCAEANEQPIRQFRFQSRGSCLGYQHVFDPDLGTVGDLNHLCTEAKVRR